VWWLAEPEPALSCAPNSSLHCEHLLVPPRACQASRPKAAHGHEQLRTYHPVPVTPCTTGTAQIARQARVALGDEIADGLGARAVLVLIGELIVVMAMGALGFGGAAPAA
jgi:hypothetical protein